MKTGDDDAFEEIKAPPVPPSPPSASHVVHGPQILPHHRVLLYSPEEWERFIEEWAFFSLKSIYLQVQRFGGAKDRGIDIAGFADDARLRGVWDNYQCKHYDNPLEPLDIWPELAKVLWHSFQGAYTAPRKYYFVSPWGVGTTVAGYLNDPGRLKSELIAVWDKACATKITSKARIELTDAFRTYVENFDFAIFSSKTGLEIVDDHRTSPYHAARFGGGLPPRPPVASPPEAIAPAESRYVTELLRAYADHRKTACETLEALRAWPSLVAHFKRQREAFYHAESLRVFARDTVPPGTFESLQEDIYDGVVDVHDADHADGYARVRAVTKAARDLHLTENALLSVSRPRDRDGVCHQLANDERLRWTKGT